jgi:hypothetical protein
MPNRKEHAVAGLIAGAVIGTIASMPLPPDKRLSEALLVSIGAILGGVAPDVIEPATSPQHRSTFHSVVVGGAGVAALAAQFRSRCIESANECDLQASDPTLTPQIRANAFRRAAAWRGVSALVLGFALGYASHLILDGGTSDGLCILTRRF